MSNYQGYGTISSITTTAEVAARGWVTVAAHDDAGTFSITWQFKGADGVWRDIYAGSDNATIQTYTAAHMANFFFGSDVLVRGNVTSASGLTLDWQILGNVANR